MSNTTTRPPCVSDERIENYADEWNKGERGITIAHRTSLVQGADWCREIYEAKWGPLIQQLVDALSIVDTDYGTVIAVSDALDMANDAGFKPR